MITNMNEKAEAAARELVKRYLTNRVSMTDADIRKMLHCAGMSGADDYDPFDPAGESPVDLFGPWWE